MKRLKYGLLAAAMVASAAVIPAAGVNAEAADGAWVKDAKGWHYVYEDGTQAKNEFVGGYWMSAAGLMQTGHNYTWMLDGGRWHFGDKTWMAGLGYLDKDNDQKNQWCKIDGKWYYFYADGVMAQSAFMGKYAVDENGVWREDVTAKWEKDGDDWRYAVTEGESTDYLADGWYYINGEWYHFNADATLDTWKVIQEIDSDGNKSYWGLGANGQRGRLTEFEWNYETKVPATLVISFSNATERLQAARDIKDLLINTHNIKEDNTDAPIYKVKINKDEKIVKLAYGSALVETKASEGETITVTESTVKTKNVWVQLNEEELAWVLGEHIVYEADGVTPKYKDEVMKDEDGKVIYGEDGKPMYHKVVVTAKNYDGTISALGAIDKTGTPYEAWIPLVSYVNNFAGKKVQDVNVTFTTSSFGQIIKAWRGLDAISRYDHKIVLYKDTDNEMTFTRFGVSQHYFGVDLDGQHYQAFIDFDTENIYKSDIMFLGDVSGATSTVKVLGKKLRQLGLVTEFIVVDTKTGNTVSIKTDGKPGWVTYQSLEQAAKDKAAEEKNAGNE